MEEGIPHQAAAFKKIDYKGVNEINYLSDFIALDISHIDYLQGLNSNTSQNMERKQQSKFDNIANELYKKIVKQGYVQKPSTVSKKSKRTDADVNYYNVSDSFIDDEEIIEKKDIFSTYKDYQCVTVNSIEELYNSQQYKAKAEEIVSESLKRKAPDQFNPDNVEELEKFDEIKKKIKNNIKQYILKRSPFPVAQERPVESAADPIVIAQDEPAGQADPTIAMQEQPKPNVQSIQ